MSTIRGKVYIMGRYACTEYYYVQEGAKHAQGHTVHEGQERGTA